MASSQNASDRYPSSLTSIHKMILVFGLLGVGLVLIVVLVWSARRSGREDGTSADDPGMMGGWWPSGSGSDHASGSEASHGGQASSADASNGDSGGGDGGGSD